MKSLSVYNLKGEEVGKKDLNAKIFDIAINKDLIKQVVEVQEANSRLNLAHTKTRAAVSGGGRKPWRQKHTGRARHGSIRSPLWRHGGVTFGPLSERNYSKNINKKMKKKALFMVLTDRAANKNITLVENLDLAEIKTKFMIDVLDKLTKTQKVLIVLDKVNEKLVKSIRNLNKVEVILADSLNVISLLKRENIIMPVAALDVIEKVYLNNSKSEEKDLKKEDTKKDDLNKSIE